MKILWNPIPMFINKILLGYMLLCLWTYLFCATFLVLGLLQQKFADLWIGIKTSDVLVLEKENDFWIKFKCDQNENEEVISHRVATSLSCLVNTQPQFPENGPCGMLISLVYI